MRCAQRVREGIAITVLSVRVEDGYRSLATKTGSRKRRLSFAKGPLKNEHLARLPGRSRCFRSERMGRKEQHVSCLPNRNRKDANLLRHHPKDTAKTRNGPCASRRADYTGSQPSPI